jgi:hypothetical protein
MAEETPTKTSRIGNGVLTGIGFALGALLVGGAVALIKMPFKTNNRDERDELEEVEDES